MKPIYQTAGPLVSAPQVVNSPGGVPVGVAVSASNLPPPAIPPDMPDPSNVWLATAPAADGLQLGTYAAPFDVSTREKFDARMATFGDNVTIHLKPGTYYTRGFPRYSTIYNHWTVRPGWKILGHSKETTVIKLVVDASAVNDVIHEQIGPGQYRTFDSAHFSIFSTSWSFSGVMSGVEIANLTLDGNHDQDLEYDGAWMRYASACFNISGNQYYQMTNCSAHDLIVRGFGNTCPGTENFVAGFSTAKDSRLYRIECIEPVSAGWDGVSTGGTSILGFFGYNNTNVVMEDCLVDGLIPGVTPASQFVGCSASGENCVVRRNTFRNLYVAGPYHDTGPVLDVDVYENYYWNVRVGLFHSLWAALPSSQRRTTFERNQVYLVRPAGSPAAVGVVVIDYVNGGATRPSEDVVVRDNFFGRSEEVDPTKHLATDVRNTKRVVIRDNVQADWGFQDYFYAINNDSVDRATTKGRMARWCR